MKAAVVPFSRGAAWLREGWRLYRVAPMTWLSVMLGYWLVILGTSALQYLQAVVVLLVPAISVGFMAVGRKCAAGEPPSAAELFSGFRGGFQRQLILGVVHLALMLLVLLVTRSVDNGALERWMTTRDPEVMSQALFVLAVMLATYAQVVLLFWFAPVLVAWHDTGVAKALFFSYFSCLMNWRAFAGYGIAMAAVIFLVPVLFMSLLNLLVPGLKPGQVMAAIATFLLALMPMIYASFYASYRDVFGPGDTQKVSGEPGASPK
ncbi:MAG: hypothetical protein FJY43_00415 [Betaproteobacteria bacterium]|nr:hypothetical protein [Betaproteobacteria bacterium]